jgi:hypothetical protein
VNTSLAIPLWGCFDVVFTLMVLAGVCGESDSIAERLVREKINDPIPVELRRKKLKKWSERILIIGLAGELICLPVSLRESAQLNERAAEAEKETA